MTGEPDEWTMYCPPGRMTDALIMADEIPENVREVMESPVVSDFVLVNDSAAKRFWQRMPSPQFRGVASPSRLDPALSRRLAAGAARPLPIVLITSV